MTMALGAAAAAGANILLVKWFWKLDPKLDALGLTIDQLVVVSLFLCPLAFAIDGTGGTDWSSGEFVAAVLFLGVGGLTFATLAFFMSLKPLPATTVSAALILVPVVAVVIEAARGTLPGGVVLVGMALAVSGVALVIFRAQIRVRTAPTEPTSVAAVDAIPPG
jgi:drug/metabolite transporter (DMT)-like permease